MRRKPSDIIPLPVNLSHVNLVKAKASPRLAQILPPLLTLSLSKPSKDKDNLFKKLEMPSLYCIEVASAQVLAVVEINVVEMEYAIHFTRPFRHDASHASLMSNFFC